MSLICFVREVSVFRWRFSRTRLPILSLNIFFKTFSDLCKTWSFLHALVGNKNEHDITHGKLQVVLGVNVSIRMKRQSYCSRYQCTFNHQRESLKGSLSFLSFVQGTYIFFNLGNGIFLMEIYDIEN